MNPEIPFSGPLVRSPVRLPATAPKAVLMACTVSGWVSIQFLPFVFSMYAKANSFTLPDTAPDNAFPPLMLPVSAPMAPWRRSFSVDPSFHPLWDAISWIAQFPTIPSSSNSRFLSSTFVLSKISLSLFKLFSVSLFSFSMSCFRFSLSVMVMVPYLCKLY